MADAGFPWFFDRPTNAYKFANGYSLKRLELSSNELFGLVALRSLGASLGGPIGSYIHGVTDKLVGSSRGASDSVKGHSPMAFRLSEVGLDRAGEKTFALLSAAERASRSVVFSYRDKEGNHSRRTVDPYGFIVSSGRVYCVAFDQKRNDLRTFAIDSVSEADVLGSTYTRPSDFDVEAFAASSISGVLHGGALTDVRVRFESRVAKAASAARVVAEREIERSDDGSVEIRYRVADVDELVRWVLGWGSQAEIIAPNSARDRARDLAEQIAGKYTSSSRA